MQEAVGPRGDVELGKHSGGGSDMQKKESEEQDLLQRKEMAIPT